MLRCCLAAAGLVAATTVALRLPAPAAATSPAVTTSTNTATTAAVSTSTATAAATVTTVATTTATSTATATTVATATGVPGGVIVIDPPAFPATVGDGRHPVVGVALVHNHAAGVYRIGEVYVTADTVLAFGLARNAVADCPDLTIAPGGSCGGAGLRAARAGAVHSPHRRLRHPRRSPRDRGRSPVRAGHGTDDPDGDDLLHTCPHHHPNKHADKRADGHDTSSAAH